MARDRIAIDQNRQPAQVAHDRRGRRERHGRNQNSLAGLESQRLDSQMQSRRTGVDRDGMRGADRRGKLLLEPADARARRQPARAQSGHDFLDLRFANIGAEKRYLHRIRRHWFTKIANIATKSPGPPWPPRWLSAWRPTIGGRGGLLARAYRPDMGCRPSGAKPG